MIAGQFHHSYVKGSCLSFLEQKERGLRVLQRIICRFLSSVDTICSEFSMWLTFRYVTPYFTSTYLKSARKSDSNQHFRFHPKSSTQKRKTFFSPRKRG